MSSVVPSIGKVPDGIDAGLRTFLTSIKTILETREGVRPNVSINDQYVTFGDLVSGSIAVVNPGVNRRGGSTVLSPAQIVSTDIPPAPTNVRTTGTMVNIFIEWDYPRYPALAFFEVWRSDNDDFASARVVGTTTGTLYSDSIGIRARYFYWVRAIGSNGRAGPFNSQSGTPGETVDDPAFVLSQLAGRIAEGSLTTTLQQRIASIEDTAAQGVSDAALAAQLAGDVSASSSALAGTVALIAQEFDTAKGQYTLRVQNGRYVAGFGLIQGDQPDSSEFVVLADRFAVVTPNPVEGEVPAVPFVVGNVAGVPTVGINGALVVDGTITGRALVAESVTADKITVQSLSAISTNLGAITAGSIDIGSGKFSVDQQGNVLLRSATSGARMEVRNNVIKVFDDLGRKRVQIGDLSA